MAAQSLADSSDDPIVASFSVFVNPPFPTHRKLLVLQQPNKHAAAVPYGHAIPFSELRIKPHAGMIEADIPIDTTDQYDKGKGMAWGAALQKSVAAKNGGSHGLPGGFGVGAPPLRPGRARAPAQDDEEHLDWAEAQRRDRVLRTQTLGGQAPELTDCRIMVGVFQGNNLHLTPATNVVHLRPQLHHLDATAEQERLSRPAPGAVPAAGATATAAGGPGGKEGGGSTRAIHMTIKSAAGVDGDTVVLETMADRLRAVQKEPWQRLRYVDENTDDAWEVYAESLVVHGDGDVEQPDDQGLGEDEDEDGDDAGPGRKAPRRDDAGGGKGRNLRERVPHLEATWEDEELLRAVSGITAEEAEVKKTGRDVSVRKDGKGKGKEVAVKIEDQPPKKGRPGRPPKSAAGSVAARKPTSRGKATSKGASASAAMDID